MTANAHGGVANGPGGGGGFSLEDLERILDKKLSRFETRLVEIEKSQKRLLQNQTDDGNRLVQLLTTQYTDLKKSALPPPLMSDSTVSASGGLTAQSLDSLLEQREKKLLHHMRETERQIQDHISLAWDHKEITTKVIKMDERLEVLMSGEGEANALMEKMLPALDAMTEKSLLLEQKIALVPEETARAVAETEVFMDLVKKIVDSKDYTKDSLDISEDVLKRVKAMQQQNKSDLARFLNDNKKDVYDAFCDVLEGKIGKDLAVVKQCVESMPGTPQVQLLAVPPTAAPVNNKEKSGRHQRTKSQQPTSNRTPSPNPTPNAEMNLPSVSPVIVSPVIPMPPGPSITAILASELEGLASGVIEIQDKMDSWLKYSKKTLNKSDDNTESLMTKLTTTNSVLANFKDEMRKEMEALKKAMDKAETPVPMVEVKPQVTAAEVKQQLIAVVAPQGTKIEEVLTRVKATEKAIQTHTNSYQANSLKMLKLVKDTETLTRGIAATHAKPGSDDDLKVNILTPLEEIRLEIQKLTGVKDVQNPALVKTEEDRFQLQRIAEIVVDVRDLLTNGAEDGNGGGQIGQLRKVLLEVKASYEAHQKGELQFLGDLKNESVKMEKTLSTVMKSKSNEKTCLKIMSSVDAMMKNSTSDAKTFSQMNTTLQGLKAGENKHLKAMEAIKQMLEKIKTGDMQELKSQLDNLSMTRLEENGKRSSDDDLAKMSKSLSSVEKKLNDHGKAMSTEVKKILTEQLATFQQKVNEQTAREQRAAATDVKKCVVDYALQTQQKVSEGTEKQQGRLNMISESAEKQEERLSEELKKVFENSEKLQGRLTEGFKKISEGSEKQQGRITEGLKRVSESTEKQQAKLTKLSEAAEKQHGNVVEGLKKLSDSSEKQQVQISEAMKNIHDDISEQSAKQSKEIKKCVSDAASEPPPSKSTGRKRSLRNNATVSEAGEDDSVTSTNPQVEENLAKIVAEVTRQTNVSSEIFNSIEDMKQLHSSMPNSLHEDVIPKLEQLLKGMGNLPTESFFAALEENLCKNLHRQMELMHQSTLQELFEKFDLLENRLVIIKKYAKYGYSSDKQSVSGTGASTNAFQAQVAAAPGNNAVVSLDASTLSQLMKHITQQCSDLASSLDFTDALAGLDSQLAEVLTVEQQILSEQAKALVVEEQLEATTHTVLQDIKPDLEQIINMYQTDVKGMMEELATSSMAANHSGSSGGSAPLPRAAIGAALTPALKRMEGEILKKLEEVSKAQESKMSLLLEDKSRQSDGKATPTSDSVAEDENGANEGIEAVKRLVSYLHKVQLSQKEILARTDQTIDFQTELNEVFKSLVQTLETIRTSLHQGSASFGSLPELCQTLQQRIEALDGLESKLSAPKSQGCEDLREIMQKSMLLLDKMLKDQGEISLPKLDGEAMMEQIKENEVSADIVPVKQSLSPAVIVTRRGSKKSDSATTVEPVSETTQAAAAGGPTTTTSTPATPGSSNKRSKRKSDHPAHITPIAPTVKLGGRPKRSRVDYREPDSDEGEFEVLPMHGEDEEEMTDDLGQESDGGDGVQEKFKIKFGNNIELKKAEVRLTQTSIVLNENPLVEEEEENNVKPTTSSSSAKKTKPGPASMTGRARGVPEKKVPTVKVNLKASTKSEEGSKRGGGKKKSL